MIPRPLHPDRRAGFLLAGAALLLFVAIGGAVVLPSVDPDLEQTSELERAYGELEEQGMDVYRSEGCWYCHTQQVRPVRTDAALGPPLLPGDYGADEPAMVGTSRLGPDLTHVGQRYADADELIALLRDPRAGGRHSSMPAYAYLAEDDLRAVAAYLLASQ